MATARRKLLDLALDQHGYVTVRDADDLDIGRNILWNLAGRNLLTKVAHGVYRFPELPETPEDLLMLAVLWTGDAKACLSHETALAVRELGDINPTRTHVTVPIRHRVRRKGADHVVVHNQDLPAGQVTWWQQIPIVTVETAIRQCIELGTPRYLLHQAIGQGTDAGDVTPETAASLRQELEQHHGAQRAGAGDDR